MAKENVAGSSNAAREAALSAANAEALAADESGIEPLDVQVIKRAAYRKHQDRTPSMKAKYETLVNMGCEDCMFDAEGSAKRYASLAEANRPGFYVDVDVRRLSEKYNLGQ